MILPDLLCLATRSPAEVSTFRFNAPRMAATLTLSWLALLGTNAMAADGRAVSPSPQAADQQAAGAAAPVASGQEMTLPFFVLAKDEKPLLNLTKEDVTIGEDGHPETILSMKSAADEPLSLGILVDTRANMSGMLQSSRKPLETFLQAVLVHPGDQAAVIDFNDDAGQDLPLTSSREKIQKALDHLSVRPAGAYQTAGDDHNVGGNVLFDALFLASDEVLKAQPGRKVIVVLTDGLDRGSKESILSSIEAAQRAHALIYTIEFPAKETKNESSAEQPVDQDPQQRQGGGYPGGGGGYPGGGWRLPGRRRRIPRRRIPRRRQKRRPAKTSLPGEEGCQESTTAIVDGQRRSFLRGLCQAVA